MRRFLRVLALLVLCAPASAWAVPAAQKMLIDDAIGVWLIQDDAVPVISMSLRFEGAGFASDPKDKQGRAQLAASLLKEGAGGMDAAAFQSYLNRNALRLSVDVGRDALVVSVSALSNKTAEAFRAIRMMLSQPQLSQAAFDRVLAQQKVALNLAKQRPGFFLGRAMGETIYGNHPYSNQSLGTEQSLEQLQLTDVQQFLSTHLAKQNLQISVAGMVRSAQLEDAVEHNLADLPKKPSFDNASTEAMPPLAAQTVPVAFDTPQSQIMVVMPGVERRAEDFYAAYLLAHVMGGSGLTSYLAEELRQKRGLTYGVFSWLDIDREAASLRTSFATAHETTAEALQALNESLDTLYQNGVTQAQLDEARAYVMGAFPLSLDSSDKLAAYLQSMQYYRLGAEYLQKRNSYFEAVTLEEVNQVAKRLLDPSKRVILWAGKQEAADE